MTQEEYEAKVQSMPKELQNQFRQSLEINLSKRIVNRFMSTVMQAYAWGQRAAQTGEGRQNAVYMRGAQDMKDALRTVFDMDIRDAATYFNIDLTNHDTFTTIRIPLMETVLKMNGGAILEIADKYRDDKMLEKDEREKAAVQAMADTIGIVKLCEIAEGIRRGKAEESGLPF